MSAAAHAIAEKDDDVYERALRAGLISEMQMDTLTDCIAEGTRNEAEVEEWLAQQIAVAAPGAVSSLVRALLEVGGGVAYRTAHVQEASGPVPDWYRSMLSKEAEQLQEDAKAPRRQARLEELLARAALPADAQLIMFLEERIGGKRKPNKAGLESGDLILRLGNATTYAELETAAAGITPSNPPMTVLKYSTGEIVSSSCELSAIDLLPLCEGRGLLHLAARFNDGAAVGVFASAGHSINTKERTSRKAQGRAPLFVGVVWEATDAVQVLCELGADLTTTNDQ